MTTNDKSFNKTKKIFFRLKEIEQEFVKGEFKNFDYFLKNIYNINHVDYALEWSAYHGRLDLVKKAMDKGGDPNYSNSAPIQMASRNGHYDIVKYLMEKGSSKSILNINILIEAIEENHSEIVNYLLGDNNYGIIIEENHEQIVNYLVDNNNHGIILCDVNTDHGYALRTAINLGRIEIVKKLINSGADINIMDGWCITMAVKQANVDIIKQLLEANINIIFVKKIVDTNYNINDEIMDLLNTYLSQKLNSNPHNNHQSNTSENPLTAAA